MNELIVFIVKSMNYTLQASERKAVKVQADDPIAFNQLINKSEMGATEVCTVCFQNYILKITCI